DNIAEAFPTRLPPLRADLPTLVVGKLKGDGDLSCSLEGTVAGREVRVQVKEEAPVAEADNFFLAGLVKQWQEHKDRPALMQADRALAHAYQKNLLARAELIAQGDWALDQNQFAAAEKLFDRACDLDPDSIEARSGKEAVGLLRQGKVTKEQL